ncbi:calmodulin-dependent protein kinase [Gigaspora margarita]|uniref:Calmodulin-dependent protein kinase n=1 Tax=Gigaspora margarita TaxID=4874 RepID=A0A8H4AHD2_GIGMA|nr:calmodulin-dependent protein kinase [Gigaspora margarita]
MNIYSEFDVLKSGESLLEINDCSEIEEKVPEEVVVIPLKDCIDMHKKKEYKSAWECFKQNAELNDPYFEEADDENNYSEAQCKYVVLLIVDLSKETDETAKENDEFIKHHISSEKGDSGEVCNLGRCYHYGIGTRKDEHEAFIYYQKAADMGNAMGVCNVEYCY